ncbi:MAG: hypothetical protein WAW90_02495 [Minisyncoccia bacterium]
MDTEPVRQPGTPSLQAQSWGTLASIVIIVLMIVVGAFYAWGKRIAQEEGNGASLPSTQGF